MWTPRKLQDRRIRWTCCSPSLKSPPAACLWALVFPPLPGVIAVAAPAAVEAPKAAAEAPAATPVATKVIDVVVPAVGESISEVTIAAWSKKEGDSVKMDEVICELESDKATMDVPSSHSGVVKEVKVKIGDNLSQGSVVITLEEGAAASPAAAPVQASPVAATTSSNSGGASIEIKVPDIGDYKDVPVIEVLVKVGDQVEKEQSIVVLESDKATMDVPSSHSGVVKEVKVKVGDSLSEGSVVLILESGASGAVVTPAAAPAPVPVAKPTAVEPDRKSVV